MNLLYFGAESANFVIGLCNAFCRAGHKVTAVVQQLDEYDKDNPIEPHENLTRINIDYEKFFVPARMHSKTLDLFAREKFDLIFGSHTPISPVVAYLARIYKLPWGIMILDVPTDAMKEERWRMRQWSFWFDVLKQADTLIFNTYVARDEYYKYTKHWFPDTHVIPAGTDLFPEYEGAGLDIEGDYVITVSRLTPKKNCLMVARALGLLKPDLKYFCIGRDRGELGFIKKVCEENNVPFEHKSLITQKEKFELIKNSAMLLYPQNTEYIAGLSPLEGMFVGKPVICGDFKILHDLYGDFPFYCDITNPFSLAETIAYVRSLKKDVIKNRLKQGVVHGRETGSFDNIARAMLKIMESIVRK